MNYARNTTNICQAIFVSYDNPGIYNFDMIEVRRYL
jgi:hypothetical protein